MGTNNWFGTTPQALLGIHIRTTNNQALHLMFSGQTQPHLCYLICLQPTTITPSPGVPPTSLTPSLFPTTTMWALHPPSGTAVTTLWARRLTSLILCLRPNPSIQALLVAPSCMHLSLLGPMAWASLLWTLHCRWGCRRLSRGGPTCFMPGGIRLWCQLGLVLTMGLPMSVE